MTTQKRKICVIGLGYVGLPVAVAFSEAGFTTLGFDTSSTRIRKLRSGSDTTFEVENNRLNNPNITFTENASDIAQADFYIITVPTPVTKTNEPDISFLISASEMVGQQLKFGDIVVYESTVYPGCTEDDCIPVLERVSQLKSGSDFFVAYSPERINPGDPNHRFETIRKVVSAQCSQSLKIVSETYAAAVPAGVFKAPSIKVAEAAKVIENTQRDLNIGFVNELSKIFNSIGVDTHDVLAAANTKWNFNLFEPGLVGGHCIGVDPYYLTSKASKIGVETKVILSGRDTNNSYPTFIADQCRRWIKNNGIESPKIIQLGLTFKENVPDIRNSKAFDLASELKIIDPLLVVIDPLANVKNHLVDFRFNDKTTDESFDIIVLAVPHHQFTEGGWKSVCKVVKRSQKTLVMDIKARMERSSKPQNIELWRP